MAPRLAKMMVPAEFQEPDSAPEPKPKPVPPPKPPDPVHELALELAKSVSVGAEFG